MGLHQGARVGEVEARSNSHHGLACSRCVECHRRHVLANDVIVCNIRSTDVHAVFVSFRLLRDDNKQSDGDTLDHWCRFISSAFKFSCTDMLATSHLHDSSTEAMSATVMAETSNYSTSRCQNLATTALARQLLLRLLRLGALLHRTSLQRLAGA